MLCFPINLTKSFVFALHKTTLKLERTMHKLLKPWQPLVWQPLCHNPLWREPEARFSGEATGRAVVPDRMKFADKAGKDLGFEVIKIAVRMAKKH